MIFFAQAPAFVPTAGLLSRAHGLSTSISGLAKQPHPGPAACWSPDRPVYLAHVTEQHQYSPPTNQIKRSQQVQT